MKLTFVSPRYGLDIVGGAEFAVRVLAENCVKHGGVEAEVLTTTAGDERTWSAHYPQGEDVLNDVRVQRFSNDPIDRAAFDRWAQDLLANPSLVDAPLFDQWLKKQGPYSPELLDAIECSTGDAMIFHPMLSSPASHGIMKAKVPTILHPALHDEPLARMPGYGNVLSHASLLAFSTRYEQELSARLHNTFSSRQCVIGFGIDPPKHYSEAAIDKVLAKFDLQDQCYVVVLGRVDPGKGSDVVARMWEYAREFIPDTQLVFIGPVSESSYVAQLSDEQRNVLDIKVTGIVSDAERDVLLSQSRTLITPSITESFSLVLLEAMSMGVPVVVNGMCGPTMEHVALSNSGTSFVDTETFVVGVKLALRDSDLRDEWIHNGQSYVAEKYSWETVVERYLDVVSSVAVAFSV
jgi:glycosyltransferase involved in cell wall biosynthesis